ncbi:MAG: hypothetical protein BA874_05735 [Desulfuromonadales bacterium C00003068]|jgi:hypothetical protein|nr:MAG: hypothetical protein BA874_05735 [Desulfuromonadales bacterium C00003068]
MAIKIDEVARENALRRYGIPEGLHVPIAAVNELAITTYVGEIIRVLSSQTNRRAFLVKVREAPPKDCLLPIWEESGSDVFFRQSQVWVDVS